MFAADMRIEGFDPELIFRILIFSDSFRQSVG